MEGFSRVESQKDGSFLENGTKTRSLSMKKHSKIILNYLNFSLHTSSCFQAENLVTNQVE